MLRSRFLALIVACACAAPGAWPLGGRRAVHAQEMRCVYTVTEETLKPPLSQFADDPASPKIGRKGRLETSTLTLGLANDYLTEQRDQSPELLVLHFPTRRIYSLDRKTRSYTDLSLYGHVGFRVNELISRLAIGAGMKEPKTSRPPWQPPPGVSAEMAARALDQFRAESLFSLRLPKGSQWTDSPPAAARQEGKTWVFLYDREPIVKFAPSDRPLPRAIRRGLLHFLVHRCRIHPTIRDRIMESDALPESLAHRSCDLPGEKSITLKLVSSSATPDAETWKGVPADFVLKFDLNNPLDRVLNKLSQRLASRHKAERKSDRDALRKRVDEALERGHALDAYLALYAHTAATGDDEFEIAERIKATHSPQLQTFLNQDAPNPEAFERRLQALDAIDRAGLSHGYVLDVHSGAMLTLLNRPAEANQRFLKALDANPLLASVYVLLGTNHFRSMETEAAWRCFDAARKANPAAPSLADVNALESRLEHDFPEAF